MGNADNERATDVTDFEEEIDKYAESRKSTNQNDRNSVSLDPCSIAEIKYQQALRTSTTYICQLCERHYRNQSRALIHINKVHNITNLDAIKYCTSNIGSTGVLWERVSLSVEEQLAELEERRLEAHYKSSPYKCHSCAMAFAFPDTFQNHNKKHHGNTGSFMCDICFSLFENESELMRHERYHKERYKCTICGYLIKCHTFISTRFTHEATHALSTKSGNMTVFPCNYCNNTYIDQKSLGTHIRCSHFFPQEYQCLICKKVLTTKTGFKLHMAMHSESKPYQCKQCGECFNTVAKKRKHALEHYKISNE